MDTARTAAEPQFRRRGAMITGIVALPWTMAADFGSANLWIGLGALVLTSGAIGVALTRERRRGPVPTPAPGWEKTFRNVGLMEGAGIVAAIAVLVPLGAPELVTGVIALVVGAHFFPLAKAFGQRQYVWTGVGLCAAGAAGAAVFALGEPTAARGVAGLGAAVVLWATSYHLSLRG